MPLVLADKFPLMLSVRMCDAVCGVDMMPWATLFSRATRLPTWSMREEDTYDGENERTFSTPKSRGDGRVARYGARRAHAG
jgi:hypothetical protein